jgi:four helix bundle protein
MAINCYEDLVVWQQAMDLVILVYGATDLLPDRERYGLISQLQRAAVSVPSNIAEGHGRRTTGEYLQLLSYSRGSLMEIRTQIEIARWRKYITDEHSGTIRQLCDSVGRLLNGLMASLERKIKL